VLIFSLPSVVAELFKNFKNKNFRKNIWDLCSHLVVEKLAADLSQLSPYNSPI
jgi:hypothetical protein